MVLKLEDYKNDAHGCVRCSNCKFIEHVWVKSDRFAKQCPMNVRYAFNAYSAPGLMHMALALIDGRLDYTPKFLDAVYKCNLCGACDVRCKRCLNLEVLAVIETLRARCVEAGKGPMPEHKVMAENVTRSKNRYGAPHDNRFKWMPKDVKPAQKADIVYFVGCTTAYTQPELAKATVKLLTSSGVQFMVLDGDEWCCGNRLYSTGQVDLAKEMAEHNIKAIENSGAKTVLASCAECYKTLKVDYPKLFDKSTEDMGFTVLHVTEYIDQLVKSGTLKFKNEVPMKVTYHDPCHLGRLSEPWYHWQGEHKEGGISEPAMRRRCGEQGVYEPPRDILKNIRGIELVEMERNRDNAWCCGAGGGVDLAFNDFALWTAGERLEEAKATGAEAIVSCCPSCKEILSRAAQQRKETIKVYDITEIMLQAI